MLGDEVLHLNHLCLPFPGKAVNPAVPDAGGLNCAQSHHQRVQFQVSQTCEVPLIPAAKPPYCHSLLTFLLPPVLPCLHRLHPLHVRPLGVAALAWAVFLAPVVGLLAPHC